MASVGGHGRGGPEPGELALSSAQPSITGVEAVRGQGAWIESADGRAYLDLAAGIATCNLGHSHPAVIAAVLDQMERVIHLGGVCGHAPQRDLAARLAGITPAGIDRFLFSTTGSEANEVALRLARTATGRPGVVCFRGSFHGRTAGALAATTSKAAFRMGLGAGGAHVAPFPRPDGLGLEEEAAVHALAELDQLHRHQLAPEETACYMIEPVQGHGGCHPAGRRFLEGLRERADAHGALLVFDEIQTGFGRLGSPFAAQHYGVTPDLMTLAKGIASGVPMAAVLMTAAVATRLAPGDMGSTFGGGPLACAALLATLSVIQAEGLMDRARACSARIRDGLAGTAITMVHGEGLLLGLRVPGRAGALKLFLQDRRILVGGSGDPDVLRLMPPLTVRDSSIDALLAAIASFTSES